MNDRDLLLEFGQWLANAPSRINMLRGSLDEDGDPGEFSWLVDRFLDTRQSDADSSD